MPRFWADERCDFAVVRGVRAAGYEVVAVAEACPGSADEDVIDLARAYRRVLITEDKDFGQLVFAAAKETSGVIFIRFPQTKRSDLIPAILNLVSTRGESLFGHFVVVEPGRIRITPLP